MTSTLATVARTNRLIALNQLAARRCRERSDTISRLRRPVDDATVSNIFASVRNRQIDTMSNIFAVAA